MSRSDFIPRRRKIVQTPGSNNAAQPSDAATKANDASVEERGFPLCHSIRAENDT